MKPLYIKSDLFEGVDMLEGLTDWEAGINDDGEYFIELKFDNLETASNWAQILLEDRE